MSDLRIRDARFRMTEFSEYHRLFRNEVESLESRIAILLAASAPPRFTSAPVDLLAEPTVLLRVHFAIPTCAGVAQNLLDLDIELRRTAEFLTSGKVRPTGNSNIIEVISAVRSSSIEFVLAAGEEIGHLLVSRPITFLQTLDWFWLHRHTRMKVRNPNEPIDPTQAWSEMLRAARKFVEHGKAVVVKVDVAKDGTATFGFRTSRGG